MSTDILHVAALPYPSSQGTQASIAAMMRAHRELGHRAKLLTYGHGDSKIATGEVEHLRLDWTFGDRSLRSGPSIRKVAQDAALSIRLRREPASLVIAHHVEAAWASWCAGRPFVFVAHTDLSKELPTYGMRSMRALLRRTGSSIDLFARTKAERTLAVSPAFARALSDGWQRDVEWLPIPWQLPPELQPEERDAARAELRVPATRSVAIYVGNLDRYQGIEHLAAVACTGDLEVVVATASTDRLGFPARRIQLDGSEAQRRMLHAASDLVLVPRATRGGISIKLIDALARGCRVVASPYACEGFTPPPDLVIAAGNSSDHFVEAVRKGLSLQPAAEHARTWTAQTFSASAYARALRLPH